MSSDREVFEIVQNTKISDEIKGKIKEFVNFHVTNDSKVVFITSGGTSVPLEEKTVRFIDNFSYGTRGSASAESFIENSIAVIYMYRKKTLQPYERHISNINLLDAIKYANSSHDSFKIDLTSFNKDFNKIFEDYTKAKESNMLIQIEYSTIFEYLTLLEFISRQLNLLKERAIIYLAAAVSDFYLPLDQMPKHKIQSNVEGLSLDLKPVPKCLGKLKSEWCPNAFVISFKLETDESLLISKSIKALEKYRHNLVIANVLETRKNQVIVIEGQRHDQQHLIKINENSDYEIEIDLIKFIIKLHSNYLKMKC